MKKKKQLKKLKLEIEILENNIAQLQKEIDFLALRPAYYPTYYQSCRCRCGWGTPYWGTGDLTITSGATTLTNDVPEFYINSNNGTFDFGVMSYDGNVLKINGDINWEHDHGSSE